MEMAMTFTVGVLYLGLIVAGSAAGTAIVLGRSRTVGVAAAIAVCLVGGIAFAMSGMR